MARGSQQRVTQAESILYGQLLPVYKEVAESRRKEWWPAVIDAETLDKAGHFDNCFGFSGGHRAWGDGFGGDLFWFVRAEEYPRQWSTEASTPVENDQRLHKFLQNLSSRKFFGGKCQEIVSVKGKPDQCRTKLNDLYSTIANAHMMMAIESNSEPGEWISFTHYGGQVLLYRDDKGSVLGGTTAHVVKNQGAA